MIRSLDQSSQQSLCDALVVLSASIAAARRQVEENASLSRDNSDGLDVLDFVGRCCDQATDAIERYCEKTGRYNR